MHAVPTAHTETAKTLTVFSRVQVHLSSNHRIPICFHKHTVLLTQQPFA